ncbi:MULTISPECIES: ribonuclease HII [Cellulophaga]|nr:MULTISPECIES: ribonuclease HII [Cellulophaga]AIM59562.1 ribonuclease HII [Cellulophaga lytica]APU09371.1 ribonuclease HII [Cellulophaga lytica]EWH12606.1 ribonuclease HII [Cellulophaga geojensis KL-A]MDO6854809.1 ribonuclease HII [Cellulophaga lytica]WQG77317.1 ribonuclease HII [Cellulophaga lytica]
MLKSYYKLINETGTDEAGRGCLAGPVTAAAIILPENFKNDILNDSKLLSEKKRELLKPIIEEQAICYGVTHIYPKKIDEINILNASILAMHKSIDKLTTKPEFIIVDGNRFKPYKKIKHECIIKGDSKFLSIAAASVLAKTYRDAYMEKIHKEFPMYNWKKNKGYPTKEHREAIREFGLTKYHRKSFKQLPEQLKFPL